MDNTVEHISSMALSTSLKENLMTAQWQQANTPSEIFTAANAALLLAGNTTRHMTHLRSTRKANISLSVIYSWTCNRVYPRNRSQSLVFPVGDLICNKATTHIHTRACMPCVMMDLLSFLHQHQCTIEKEDALRKEDTDSDGQFFTSTIPCSLIFLGLTSSWHGPQNLLDSQVPLLIYVPSFVDNFSSKKRIDFPTPFNHINTKYHQHHIFLNLSLAI